MSQEIKRNKNLLLILDTIYKSFLAFILKIKFSIVLKHLSDSIDRDLESTGMGVRQ